ncbi:VanZ family protein [Campylobacter sp. RM9344]|uniref:VanZ family protein n=1 Tax=Campylobacter californiensis TaxID=1032243 RepID=A0AAW3ZTF7_9BACT|nr:MULTISPECIES: VanZ family protein [unclassified Campylobacter]MBE2985042.1 VanZ family protein [Campylobacter sp. RM6883]MBE2987209.1 VanZ family protein [Campylobacter sp. RM12919]MBE2988858.1 VanZ family protein [Campylobacter sp. RM12920]MBE2995634.1 VanZ family protein [Campylobacter sp. RM6913]MBE3022240.1 VanZ family protein [Campylobacter sp. 7477a]MBE3029206.1 VanZ family protein [Campylobacter sp. RM9344]
MDKLYKFGFFATLFVVEFLATTSRKITVNELFWDKTNHILAFFVLYVLLNLAFELKFWYKFVLLLAYGIQIELVQSLLPNRFFSLFDVLADSVGITLGAIFTIIFTKIKHEFILK